jgi:hypothetical protein
MQPGQWDEFMAVVDDASLPPQTLFSCGCCGFSGSMTIHFGGETVYREPSSSSVEEWVDVYADAFTTVNAVITTTPE